MKKTLFSTLLASSLIVGSSAFAIDDQQDQAVDKPHKKHHKKQLKHDLNADGMISKDEFLNRAAERFTKIDADRDGILTKDELRAFRKNQKQFRQEKRTEKKAQREERKAKREERKAKREERRSNSTLTDTKVDELITPDLPSDL